MAVVATWRLDSRRHRNYPRTRSTSSFDFILRRIRTLADPTGRAAGHPQGLIRDGVGSSRIGGPAFAGPTHALIYFDYNRTTPVASGVLDAMKPFWSTHFMLPGQEHSGARAVAEAMEHAREQVAALVNAESFEIVFTSGGTEANNLAMMGHLDLSRPGHVVVSAIEGDAVVAAAEVLASAGFDVQAIGCDADATIDVDAIDAAVTPQTQLVCVQLANPIVGSVQPIAEIVRRVSDRAPVHCDATGALGRIPVDVQSLGVATLAISGHKFFGPKGSGAVFVRRGVKLNPIHYGVPREMGVRPGSENVPGCIGLGAAAAMAMRCALEADLGLKDLRDELIIGLCGAMDPAPVLLASDAPRLPNTIALELPGESARITAAARQLVVGTPQCSDPPCAMTRTLSAMGRTPPQIGRTIHLGLGWATTRDEIARCVELLVEGWESVRP